MRVAIVGAGLGGLCLAQGLARAGIEFIVIESDANAQIRGQGYRLRIDRDGQRALARCLTPESYGLFRASCACSGMGRFLNPNLQEFEERRPANWQQAAQVEPEAEDCSANRQTLREILLHGAERHVHWGQKVCDFAQDTNGISLYCASGEHFRADIAVAADGVYSALRDQYLSQAKPEYIGAINIYGKTPLTPEICKQLAPELLDGVTVIFADGFTLVIEPMQFRAPMQVLAAQYVPTCRLSAVGNYMYWTFFGLPEKLGGALPSLWNADHSIRDRIANATDNFHPHIRRLLAHGDPDTFCARPVSMATHVPQWETTRLTLLGDAIHAMSPAGGLGANTALCDAVSLSTHLAQNPRDFQKALAGYEKGMRERAERALALTRAGTERLLRKH